jgi:hypothetical protein
MLIYVILYYVSFFIFFFILFTFFFIFFIFFFFFVLFTWVCSVLAAGDITAVGERGTNLSGGQRARLQLARTVYMMSPYYTNLRFEKCYKRKKEMKEITIVNDKKKIEEKKRLKIEGEEEEGSEANPFYDENYDPDNYCSYLTSGGEKACGEEGEGELDRDIYLLDDPLSSVDGPLARWIFKKCIKELLIAKRKKTVIMATNILKEEYLKSADLLVIMENRRIVEQGSYNELKSKGMDVLARAKGVENIGEIMTVFQREGVKEEKMEGSDDNNNRPHKVKTTTKQDHTSIERRVALQQLTDEECIIEPLSIRFFYHYLCSLAPTKARALTRLLLFMVVMILVQGWNSVGDYWVNVLASPTALSSFSFNLNGKLITYTVLGSVLLILLIGRSYIYAKLATGANRTIHKRLLSHILRCPPIFFYTTEMGWFFFFLL